MKQLKMLMIGNSFSEDTVRYVYDIAYAAGIEKVIVCNMYIGGCNLYNHCKNALNNTAAYDFQTYENGEWKHNTEKTLGYGIKYADWDYISLQQSSGLSGIPSSYACLQNLMEYVKKTATNGNFKFVWNMTWAYQQNSTHGDFAKYGLNQTAMYNAIVNTVKSQIIDKGFAFVIPNGTAIQNARTSFIGDSLTRDGFHLSYDVGRFIAGLTLVRTLCGKILDSLSYAPNGISHSVVDICKESVENAVRNAFEVTPSAFTEN